MKGEGFMKFSTLVFRDLNFCCSMIPMESKNDTAVSKLCFMYKPEFLILDLVVKIIMFTCLVCAT